ncbi:MAG: 8-amino-7-oxononanoate synthase [Myxococcota bacterium]
MNPPERSRAPAVPDARLQFVADALHTLTAQDRYRSLSERPAVSTLAGRVGAISFCSNDYLGLANDPRVIEGARQALNAYGAGAGSARLIAGELSLYRRLERALAEWLGFEDALLFNSGYHANMALASGLMDRGGVICSDALNHASMIDGCRLSRAQTRVYAHNQVAALEQALQDAGPGPKLVLTEGLFSMDGDVSPLEQVRAVALRHGALLAVDDAHALGCLGDGGRGLAWAGTLGAADVLVGTFGKAFGSAGAFVAGPACVRELLINRARPFIFTTGPAPASVGAALAALEVMQHDPTPRERLRAHTQRVRESLTQAGVSLGESVAHIIPVMVGTEQRALALSAWLLEQGLDLRAIRPPTVPEGTCRLRLTLSAGHTEAQLDRLVERLIIGLKR